MATKPKKPPIPAERDDTIRHGITALLSEGALSARDISAEVHIPEKEVYDHLEHIRTSHHAESRLLKVTPAVCLKCGFEFRKRERLRKPGKCPVCQGEHIEPPLFSLG
jgi:transcriptional regulator